MDELIMPSKVIESVQHEDGTRTHELLIGGALVGRHIQYSDGTADTVTFVDWMTTNEVKQVAEEGH